MTWQRAFNISIGVLVFAVVSWIGTELGNISDYVIEESLRSTQPFSALFMDIFKAINIVDPYLSGISFIASIITFIGKYRVNKGIW